MAAIQVNTRWDEGLLGRVQDRARLVGKTRSEWIRRACEKALDDAAAIQPVIHALTEQEWRLWLWYSEFMEKCLLNGMPLDPGFELAGNWFTIDFDHDRMNMEASA